MFACPIDEMFGAGDSDDGADTDSGIAMRVVYTVYGDSVHSGGED